MTAWPAALPLQPLVDGFRETLPETTLRTDMDQGPAKIRQRFTRGTGKISARYLLTAAETALLDDFFNTALAGGSLSFDYTHPRTGEILSCRFRAAPAYAAISAGYFTASLELEVLP